MGTIPKQIAMLINTMPPTQKIIHKTFVDKLVEEGLTPLVHQLSVSMFQPYMDDTEVIAIISNPGTGKTLGILLSLVGIHTQYLRVSNLQPSPVLLVSYSSVVILEELKKFPQMFFCGVYSSSQIAFIPMGYKKFATEVFNITDEDKFNEHMKSNKTKDPFEMLEIAISKNICQIRHEFVNKLKGCVVVFDEAHNLQNSIEANHHGLAALWLKKKKIPKCIIYVSATVLNAKKDELAYIQSLISNDPLPYSECFLPSGEFIPDWKEKIIPRFKGNIFFSGNAPNENTPELIYRGVDLVIEMDKKHFTVPSFKYVPIMASQNLKEYSKSVVNVQYSAHLFLVKHKDKWFYTDEHFQSIIQYPTIQKDIGLNVGLQTINSMTFVTLSGKGLLMENIHIYSPKIAAMMNQIMKDLTVPGKRMVHVNEVQLGATLITDVFRENGFIEYGTASKQNTICVICKKRASESHNGHQFTPTVFVVVHAYTNVDQMLTLFNSNKNMHGLEIKILVCTNVINMSYNLKNTNAIYDLEQSTYVSTMVQLHHRPKRTNAFTKLNSMEIHVYLYVIVFPSPQKSREIISLYQKFYLYYGIKDVTLELHKIAEDGVIFGHEKQYHDTFMPDSEENLPHIQRLKEIKDLPVTEAVYYARQLNPVFNSMLMRMIKQLFGRYRVLTFKKIAKMIWDKEYITTNINTKNFTKDQIRQALNQLTQSGRSATNLILENRQQLMLLYQLSDVNIVHNDGTVGHIIRIADTYVFCGKDTNFAFDVSLRTNQLSIEIPFDLTKNKKSSEMSIDDIEVIFGGVKTENILTYMKRINKKEMLSCVKTILSNYNKVGTNGINFIKILIKSQEVFYGSNLSVSAPSYPCAYVYDNELRLWTGKEWVTHQKSVILLKEEYNDIGIFGYYNDSNKLKIMPVEDISQKDGYKRNGQKCVTLTTERRTEIYKTLYLRVYNSDPPRELNTSILCLLIQKLLFTMQTVKQTTSSDPVFTRFIYLLQQIH